MIEKDRCICNNCKTEIHEYDNHIYTDNGSYIVGDFCLCEFCYLNLRKAW